MKRIMMYFVPALLILMVSLRSASASDIDYQLAHAANICDSKQVRALIQQGANVNAIVYDDNGKGHTVLAWANMTFTSSMMASTPEEIEFAKECDEVVHILEAAGAR